MKLDYNHILKELNQLPAKWHASGPLDGSVMKTLAEHCESYGNIRNSAETGAGISTLFFSQVSDHHIVFAIDVGKSLTKVKDSDLLCKENVLFVDGPTQKTLPAHNFSEKLDVVLIDGPHGYPFPDLEYYYFYPLLVEGGLLIIDDINIPSIRRMVDIIKTDEMFDCLNTVGKTMFFRRTDAPTFDPLADGWWEQIYNKPYLYRTKRLERVKQKMPNFLFNLIPDSLRLYIQKYL